MKTNGEVVSDIVISLKALNKDNRISRRRILNALKERARTYIIQRLEDGKISKQSNLITEIPCVQFKEDSVVNCKFIQFNKCSSLMKSTKKSPSMLFSRHGAAAHLTSIDGKENFDWIDFQRVESEYKREYGGLDARFTIAPDGYIYILNPKSTDIHISGGKLSVLTLDVLEAMKLSECNDCECKSVWEMPFICPDLVIDNVISTVIQEFASITTRIPSDENPNMDNNQPTQTKQ